MCERSFRGVASEDKLSYSFEKVKNKGFTQYRGGFKDQLGRCSDVSFIVPATEEWKARLARVNDGLDAVEEVLYQGVSASDLDSVFLDHMDESRDKVYGHVVHHMGFKSHEDYGVDDLREFDFVNVGVVVEGEKGERAIVYRGGRMPLENPTSFEGVDEYDEMVQDSVEEVATAEGHHEPHLADEDGDLVAFESLDSSVF